MQTVGQIIEGVLNSRLRPRPGLTPEELEIVLCVSRGLSTAEIAAVLGIGRQGVKNHLTHIYDKLGYSSRVELLAALLQHGTEVLGIPRAGAA